ncbi:MAG TPA: Na/Pi cotransporter family protein [Candidatus Sulfotelmatobacter sp.]|nr:Na/Pi cotransporter family protein [Candidatus Sulfotelmatobacter sp.]
MFLIRLAAGLALILFGVRFLRKGLDRLLGGRLIVWLERATGTRLRAMSAGIAAGIVAPSSTGLSLLTAQILGNGRASTEKLLAVLIGANVGMTVLANIAALQVGNYAGLLLLAGVIGFQFTTPERLRGVGQCILSLGFIFLAMHYLQEGADDFGKSHDISVVFGMLDQHPYALCLAAAMLAVLLQSSTATVVFGIGLATGGILPESLFVNWIVGTNVGLGLTSLFVARNNLEGRRLGIANLLAKIIVAILVIAFVPRNLFLLEKLSIPVPQQLALMHTAFNLTVAILSFPFLEWLLAFVKKTFVPDLPISQEAPKTFLNPEALEAAPIALAHATRETLHMSDEVKVMFQNLWSAHIQNNSIPIRNIRSQDDTVDEINRQLMLYLSQISDMNDFDRKWHFTLLSHSGELEAIGDIIEKNLAATVAKQLTENLVLNPDDEAVLNHLYQKTLLQFDLAASFITMREQITAQKVLDARDEINDWCLIQKKTHYERLKPGDRQGLSNSLCFLDMLDGLRRISNHLSTAAYGFKPAGVRQKKPKAKAAVQNPAQPNLIPPASEHSNS